MQDSEKGSTGTLVAVVRLVHVACITVKSNPEPAEVVVIENSKDQIRSRQPKHSPFSNESENMTS